MGFFFHTRLPLLGLIVRFSLAGCGADTVTLPNVEGQSQPSAVAELEAHGLEADVDRSAMPGTAWWPGLGEVVGQAPQAGEEVEKGTTVTIILGE